MVSRKIIDTYYDIALKHRNITVKDLRKYKKLRHRKNKLKQYIHFLNNWKQRGVYPKFFIFKLSNVSNKDSSIRKRLLRSTINKRNNEIQHVLKELSLCDNFLSKQLSTIDLYILNKSITTSLNRKLLQKFLSTQQKKIPWLARNSCLSTYTANITTTNLIQYELNPCTQSAISCFWEIEKRNSKFYS